MTEAELLRKIGFIIATGHETTQSLTWRKPPLAGPDLVRPEIVAYRTAEAEALAAETADPENYQDDGRCRELFEVCPWWYRLWVSAGGWRSWS